MANLRLLTLKIRTENKIFLRPDFDKLVKIVKSYGCRVKSYKEAEDFIKYHKLEELTKIYRAFAYEYDDEIIVLYRDSLKGEQLLFALAHEIGHLALQHDEKTQRAEDEADEFARLFIGNTYLRKAALVMIIALIFVTTLLVRSCSKSSQVISNNVTPSLQTESATVSETIETAKEQSGFETALTTTTIEKPTLDQGSETEGVHIADPEHLVYISKSGNKYHSADCYHINVDNCTMISKEQAVSLGYEPCKTCRPDVEVIQSDESRSNTVEEYIDEPETKFVPFTEAETEFVTDMPDTETTTEIQPIEINQATLEDFMTIPGIDEEKATAILELRNAINGFQHPYEILYAEGISQEFLASIIDYLYIESTELTT